MKSYNRCWRGHSHLVDLRKSKVCYFDLSGIRDENVLWLQVTMHDLVSMKKFYSIENIECEILERVEKLA